MNKNMLLVLFTGLLSLLGSFGVNGMSVEAKLSRGRTYGNLNLIKEAVAEGITLDQLNESLALAARNSYLDIVEFLLLNGADINSTTSGSTPLTIAAETNGAYNLNIVKFLINKGADINKQGIYGWTPLMSAAIYGHKDIVAFLLSCGADANVKNRDGETVFDIAKNSTNKNMTKIIEEGLKKYQENIKKELSKYLSEVLEDIVCDYVY